MNKNIIFKGVHKIIDIINFYAIHNNSIVIFYGIFCSSNCCISIFHVMEFSDMGKA